MTLLSKPKMAFGRRVAVPGCDDAPVVSVEVTKQPKPVTMVYPYYENPQMLRQQFEHWRWAGFGGWPSLRAIIVDDGSPEMPAAAVLADIEHPGPMRLFRIEIDVRWNWLAARNIGVSHAKGWVILTDMDHVIPEATIHGCIFGNHDPGVIYRFMRREHTGEVIHPHPNSWFMTTDMFWRIGGYDEALSGHYGTDGEFRRRCVVTAPIRILTDDLVRYEQCGDASTTRYLRKQPEDARVRDLIAARGRDWRPKTLSFPFHEVAL